MYMTGNLQGSRGVVLRRYKHWLPSIFELKQLRELTVTAVSTWVRLPQEFCYLTNLERLTIQMRIEGGCDTCQSMPSYLSAAHLAVAVVQDSAGLCLPVTCACSLHLEGGPIP